MLKDMQTALKCEPYCPIVALIDMSNSAFLTKLASSSGKTAKPRVLDYQRFAKFHARLGKQLSDTKAAITLTDS